MTNSKQKKDLLFWIALTAAVVLIILFFGLRPKGMRWNNAVHWLPEKGAIAFGKNGVAFVDDFHTARKTSTTKALSIELVVRAASISKKGFGSLLMMHDGSDRRQLIVGQWESSIIVMNGNDFDHTKKLPRLAAKDAFSTEKVTFLTITASTKATQLYIDGGLAGTVQGWQLTVPDQAKQLRIILGNSANAKLSWSGEIYGLAVYERALAAETVKRHYDRYVQEGSLTPNGKNDLLVLYSFRDQGGNSVPDLSDQNQPLILPIRPIVLEKTFLSAPWNQFKLNRSFFIDTTLNVVGFIPLGAVLFYWLKQTNLFAGRYHLLATLISCSMLSLGMEILQAWIPTRSSSLMDFSMNTLGAWLGIFLFNRLAIVSIKK